jgi:hypothetical protein
MVSFDTTDIGLLVLLSIRPESDPIAKALGARTVQVKGRIKGLSDDYLIISKENVGPNVIAPKPGEQKIRYDRILSVNYLAE